MFRRPPRSTRTDTLFPYTTLFRSKVGLIAKGVKGPFESLSTIPLPAIAHVNTNGHAHHYMVIYRVSKHQVHVMDPADGRIHKIPNGRSEEHTSELQSLMRISYAVFCLKKKRNSN